MSLIHLFRRLVFAQVMLGLSAFCVAERNPGMLLVCGALAAMSWYVTEGPGGRPLPKWVINLGSLAAVAWLIIDLFWQEGDVVLAMGHFTLWLQVLLLYANKSNRDYAQLIVLSLMQMVGGSVLEGGQTMFFGALLLGYSVLTLFTVLVFHLKGLSDLVLEQHQRGAPRGRRVPRAQPIVGRGHRWQFRSAAMAIGFVCATLSVVVFVLAPRSGRRQAGQDSPLAARQTGFSNEVNLNAASPSGGSREPLLSLAVSIRDTNAGADDRSWLLRGAALDHYNFRDRKWQRGGRAKQFDLALDVAHPTLDLAPLPPGTPTVDATITLRTGLQRTLFTLHPVTSFQSVNITGIEFNAWDQTLSLREATLGAVAYRTRSPLTTRSDLFDRYHSTSLRRDRAPSWPTGREPEPATMHEHYALGWGGPSAGAIRQLAQEVLRAAGLNRDPKAQQTPHDPAVARALDEFLRTQFSYARVSAPPPSEDPILDFLFKTRQGHCEHFASGLAALARSVGLRARVVTGFRASEFNRVGGYYVVRATHAHAWTEVWCEPWGWLTFDATPPREVERLQRVERGWFTGVRELYEHLEFAWIGSVIAYDARTREALLKQVSQSMRGAAGDADLSWTRLVHALRSLREGWEFGWFSWALVLAISGFIVLGLASLVRTLLVRRQRMVALQLTRLPLGRRRTLARRLRFYLEMLDMLDRHGFHRPAWQSPAHFAQELAATNPMRFDPVVSLTEHFYEVRFGYREMDEPRRKMIQAHLSRLQQSLLGMT